MLFLFSFLGSKNLATKTTMITIATTPPQTPPATVPMLDFLPGEGESADEVGAAVEDVGANLLDVEVLEPVLSESDDAMSG